MNVKWGEDGGGRPVVQRQGLWIFFFKSKRPMKVSQEEIDKGRGRALEVSWDYRLWIQADGPSRGQGSQLGDSLGRSDGYA